jgi:hypothetical protein
MGRHWDGCGANGPYKRGAASTILRRAREVLDELGVHASSALDELELSLGRR